MKYVVDVQAVDVFAGYDIDFGVPFRIECAEAFELPAGSGIDVGEIFKYKFYIVHITAKIILFCRKPKKVCNFVK